MKEESGRRGRRKNREGVGVSGESEVTLILMRPTLCMNTRALSKALLTSS